MKQIVNRLRAALEVNPKLITSMEDIASTLGFTEGQMESYGLSRSDLKRLERLGFALRGYEPCRTGYEVRWILFANPAIIEQVESTQNG